MVEVKVMAVVVDSGQKDPTPPPWRKVFLSGFTAGVVVGVLIGFLFGFALTYAMTLVS